MRTTLLLLAAAAVLAVTDAVGQAFPPRSQDYLFTPLVDDVRALWVNPAGLAIVREASIMAEVVLDQPDSGNVRVSQWTLGFNTRGISVGYKRDRLYEGPANQHLRIGLARPFRGGAAGIDLGLYWSDVNDRGFGAGVTYRLMPSVDASAVVRDIGQPWVRGVKLPATGVLGIAWSAPEDVLQVGGEVVAKNRLSGTGVDMSYRAGARLTTPKPFPIAALAAIDLGSDFSADRFFIGLAVGGTRRLVLGGTFLSGSDSGLDIGSISGVASNRQTPIR
ncbi:MAG: hypothetical protein JSW51_09455 [Gemmatimonadota bacterium]|nr:MAG: hypothetical protein JSW51_09455 [Gemmatimonadota bacterium]